MFRFTIRDVLWLTVLVAMGAGWYVHYGSWKRSYNDAVRFMVKEANDSTLKIIELSGQVAALKKASQSTDVGQAAEPNP